MYVGHSQVNVNYYNSLRAASLITFFCSIKCLHCILIDFFVELLIDSF